MKNKSNVDSHCICCDQESKWCQVTSLPSFLFGKESTVLRCSQCGLGKTNPMPETTIEYYEDNQNYDTLFLENRVLYESFASNLLNLVKERAIGSGNTLLDIGCGGGFLVSAASKMGFVAKGIDANKTIVSWAQGQGIDVDQGDVEERIFQQEKYDVVVLSAVLEHVSTPLSLLLQAKELLKPGGVILISQASFDGLLPKVFPWGWYGWQPEEHYWHFTPKSFLKLALQQGLKVKECKRNSLYHQFYMSGGIKVILGRNVATLIARLGNLIGRGDNFDCVLTAEAEESA